MFAKERRDEIFNIIKLNGAVTTAGLVKNFGVSVETIRRDLLAMEQSGYLLRVHGGAVAKNAKKTPMQLKDRNKEYMKEKEILSRKAIEFIKNGDVIGVDTGSTAGVFAKELKNRFSKLTVVTHSLDVFEVLNDDEGIEVILCGGNFVKSENTFCGLLTLEMYDRVNLSKSFIFPAAVSLRYGVCDNGSEFNLVQRHMIASSSEIFILADSSKFEQRATYKLDDMADEYIYITDGGLSDELKRVYKENNKKIYVGE